MQAVNYYEASLKNSPEPQPDLRYELTELYLKKRQFDKAERTIRAGLARETGGDLSTLIEHAKLNILLARVRREAGDQLPSVVEVLQTAREIQSRYCLLGRTYICT